MNILGCARLLPTSASSRGKHLLLVLLDAPDRDPLMIIGLHDPDARDPGLVGRKAASLAKLIALGFDVPRGFCVPCVAAASIAVGSVKGHLRTAIIEALNGLPPPWAVRSSSTAEDSDDSAFPGIFKTVLGVTSTRDALRAIGDVVSSVSSPLVQSYMRARGLPDNAIEMAVLVQELAPAAISGVAFSVHPVTGAEVVVIEANYGYGESVVDGSVTPDRYLVSTDGRVVVDQIGSKLYESQLTPEGVVRVPTTPQQRQRPSLSIADVKQLAALVRDVVGVFGNPQDVEWVRNDNGFVITQSRPITSAAVPG